MCNPTLLKCVHSILNNVRLKVWINWFKQTLLWGYPWLGCAECWSGKVAMPGITGWSFHWYTSSFFPSTEALCDLSQGLIICPASNTRRSQGLTWWPVLHRSPLSNTKHPWGTVMGSCWRLDGSCLADTGEARPLDPCQKHPFAE